MDKLRFVIILLILLNISVALRAATQDEFDAFKNAMIERGCEFRSSNDGKELQKELGFSNGLFSEIMLKLALQGKFKCPSGCVLIHPACPKPE